MHPVSLSWALRLALATLLSCAPACAVLGPDPARDARLDCDKKHDGSACFAAGNMVVEKNGGAVNADALRLYTRGCAARSSACCEALGNVKGALREAALVDGCNGGDVVSCVRRASELPKDESGQNEARALLHSACKRSVGVRPGMSAREIEGMGEACASLARMIATGEGGGKDAVAAAKLDVLAAVLRIEALYQHEREDDAKVLPHPAQLQAEPTKRRGGILGDKKSLDPTAPERERFRREYEARRAAREAWTAAVDVSATTAQKKASRGDPTLPLPGPLERALASGPATTGSASQCQTCVEGCGGIARCSGDDFVGSRCGSLKTSGGAAYETCVAECAATADASTRACGECGAEAAAPKGGR